MWVYSVAYSYALRILTLSLNLLQDLGKYLSVNDSLNQALESFDKLRHQLDNQEPEVRPRKAAASPKEAPALIDFFDDPAPAHRDNQVEEDPFAQFARARAGSTSKSSERGSISSETRHSAVGSTTGAFRSNQDEDDKDDPFASFVDQRAHKSVASTPAETKPAASEVNLIDFGDGKSEWMKSPYVSGTDLCCIIFSIEQICYRMQLCPRIRFLQTTT